MMEGSEVKSEESQSVDQPHNNLFDVKEEEISHSSAQEAETCCQATLQLESKLPKITTDVELDTNTEHEAPSCSQDHPDEKKVSEVRSDASTVLIERDTPPLSLSNEAAAILRTPANTQDVAETPSSVLEGTEETLLTFDAPIQNDIAQPLVLVTGSAESSPVDNSDSAESLSSSSVQSTSKFSPTDSATTSGISNGPSTPSSDTLSSSLSSSPQTSANNSGPSHSSSNPYDTDCSRKLISQIQRSLSQESLLDELESELLACQLPEGESRGERKGSPPVNGLTAGQEDCMVVFEKCVQYKYAQQEKAIQK